MRPDTTDIRGLLGLALRASHLVIGDAPVCDLIASGRARAVFTASDSGANIVKKIERVAQEKDVPVLQIKQTKEELGFALGRSSCAVCALSDSGFATAAAEKLSVLSQHHADAAIELAKKHERFTARKNKPKKNKIRTESKQPVEYIDIDEDKYNRKFKK